MRHFRDMPIFAVVLLALSVGSITTCFELAVASTLCAKSVETLRWFAVQDLPNLYSINEYSFDASWDEAKFSEVIHRPHVEAMVFEEDGMVRGFLIYEKFEDHFKILNIGVWRGSRGRGIGRKLVDQLKAFLRPGKKTFIEAEVSELNLAASEFFARMGFSSVLVQDQAQDDAVDKILFSYKLKTADDTDGVIDVDEISVENEIQIVSRPHLSDFVKNLFRFARGHSDNHQSSP